MPTLTDLIKTPLSGYNHIDALLNSSPHWNYFQPATANTLFYTFVIAPGDDIEEVRNLVAFSPAQRYHATQAFVELARYTGIRFVETQDPGHAQLSLVNADIMLNAQTTGLAAWSWGYEELSDGGFADYAAAGTLYMDNVEFGAENGNLQPGTRGFQTLLHELGHLMGLKHPHESTPDNPAQLPPGQDGTHYTVMSYSSFSAPSSSFAPYDIAALRWLYGGDGFGGARGATEGSGMYLTGTPFADHLHGGQYSDLLEGGFGSDVIDGGAGTDFVRLDVPKHLLTLERTAEGWLLGDGESVDQLLNVERIVHEGGAIALDANGTAGQAYRLYNAVFDRAPDLAGLGFWIAQLDKGVPLRDVAAGFMSSNEFLGMYGPATGNREFVEQLYRNVLDREGDQAGIDFWVRNLEEQATDQATVLSHFSDSGEFNAALNGAIGEGFPYTPWV